MREQCPQCHKEYQQHRRIYTELMSSVERSAYREQFPAITKLARKVALHHGTGCRYGMCAKHCTCAATERKTYREVRRNERTSHAAHSGYICCTQCSASTGHRHARYVEFEGEGYGSRGLHRAITRRCAVHCGHPECVEVLPCTERHFPIVLITCVGCQRVFDEADTTTETDGRPQCFSCDSSSDRRICTNSECSGWQYGDCLCSECGACYHETDTQIPQHCRCASITRPRLVRCPTHYDHLDEGPRFHCDTTNPVPRGVGVEIEVCGFNKPKRSALERLYNVCLERKASIGTDGSVGDNGIEIRTAPIIGKIAVEHITEICKALHDANAIVDQRCGLHVHVDVRHVMDHTQLHPNYMHFGLRNGLDTMLIAWRMLEDTFYNMVPDDRWIPRDSSRQMYCKKLFTANTMPWENSANALSYAVNRGWFATTRAMVRDRYHGFNTQAFDKYQTVEFRLHEGTINAQDILAWSMLCAAFVDTCVRAPKPEELLSNIVDMGPIAFLQYIAPSQAARDYVTRRVS